MKYWTCVEGYVICADSISTLRWNSDTDLYNICDFSGNRGESNMTFFIAYVFCTHIALITLCSYKSLHILVYSVILW